MNLEKKMRNIFVQTIFAAAVIGVLDKNMEKAEGAQNKI